MNGSFVLQRCFAARHAQVTENRNDHARYNDRLFASPRRSTVQSFSLLDHLSCDPLCSSCLIRQIAAALFKLYVCDVRVKKKSVRHRSPHCLAYDMRLGATAKYRQWTESLLGVNFGDAPKRDPL